jgi:hypothetical protein
MKVIGSIRSLYKKRSFVNLGASDWPGLESLIGVQAQIFYRFPECNLEGCGRGSTGRSRKERSVPRHIFFLSHPLVAEVKRRGPCHGQRKYSGRPSHCHGKPCLQVLMYVRAHI